MTGWRMTAWSFSIPVRHGCESPRDVLNGQRVFDEAEYVRDMARRIAALVLLEPALDANYERVKAQTWPWPR